ncbi:MAG: hypothetical protein KBA53_02845 [Thermoclostridium sp.]|nr:hypothetical protein [Thermoclostridium sp.]
MDKITNAKTKFRIKQWTKIIEACQTSGMTVASWCSQNNVKVKSYYYWLRRIRILHAKLGHLSLKKQSNRLCPYLSVK